MGNFFFSVFLVDFRARYLKIFVNRLTSSTRDMDATWTFTNLILVAALVMCSKAWRLNVTSEEIEIGKTAQVSLNCFNPYQQPDISEILLMRIQKKQLSGWFSVAELRDDDVDVRLTAKDVTATGSIVSGANSYMRLSWPLATNDTIGLYRCDVTILNSHGSVGWQKSLPISITHKSDVTVQILSEMVEENKRQCMQQKQDIQEYVAAAIEENKKNGLKEKQDVLQNMTATLKALEASFDSKLDSKIQALSHTVELYKRECPHQLLSHKRQILENVAAALDRNRKEGLQQSQDLLVNVTSIMEDLEASFESKLSVVKSQLMPQSCAGAKGLGIQPVLHLSSNQLVVCDTVMDKDGWIVIQLCLQRRASADVDFFRGWADYKNGFGDLSGNFWLGLEKIHQLTSQVSCLHFDTMDCPNTLSSRSHHQGRYELRFDLRFQGKNYYASYNKFSLSGEKENYRIQISGFSGNVKDRDMAYHNGEQFSTKDRDNDSWGDNCAKTYHGAWWYKSCHHVNLNGLWGSTGGAKGLRWLSVTAGTVSFSEMKIRPFSE
ncbi:fibrinogen C domain-containing protein 1-like [Aplysia californica]|uniref:Fibrinogen C domain-containing protein 1-like n=1 Tax=Aplysia californica TaxID=6500 RepID=A0ABM1VVF0_APLCA|nr:fibrinogen C domain-containing protein 1-like [Aplysia californica]